MQPVKICPALMIASNLQLNKLNAKKYGLALGRFSQGPSQVKKAGLRKKISSSASGLFQKVDLFVCLAGDIETNPKKELKGGRYDKL